MRQLAIDKRQGSAQQMVRQREQMPKRKSLCAHPQKWSIDPHHRCWSCPFNRWKPSEWSLSVQGLCWTCRKLWSGGLYNLKGSGKGTHRYEEAQTSTHMAEQFTKVTTRRHGSGPSPKCRPILKPISWPATNTSTAQPFPWCSAGPQHLAQWGREWIQTPTKNGGRSELVIQVYSGFLVWYWCHQVQQSTCRQLLGDFTGWQHYLFQVWWTWCCRVRDAWGHYFWIWV